MDKYKATLRIPCEQYAYIEIQVEGTPEEIVKSYANFTKLSKENLVKLAKDERSASMIKNDHAKVIREFTNNK